MRDFLYSWHNSFGKGFSDKTLVFTDVIIGDVQKLK